MQIHIIIGKNFGDEGKGLATDYFAHKAQEKGEKCLVIKHNGGAQAGHTVDLPDKRFVFHQLSSGSFRGADTFWEQHFLPDLYKLGEELKEFISLSGKKPVIYAHPECRLVLIDDVILNMAVEKARDKNRHGSCGMGINEAVVRSQKQEARLQVKDIWDMNEAMLFKRLMEIRRNYVPKRLEELGLEQKEMGEYGELLQEEQVLKNVAEVMCQNKEKIHLVEDVSSFISKYDQMIFEGAQGLLLDDAYEKYAPYLTPSNTGCTNPIAFLKEQGISDKPELVYVSRTYVTRHGAGPLPEEIKDYNCIEKWKDQTNVPNPWQGCLRWARHPGIDAFIEPVQQDVKKADIPVQPTLMLTHCDETTGTIWLSEGNIKLEDFQKQVSFFFERTYLVMDKNASYVRKLE
ncbi:MAG: adenylosuccinate synthetase [Roseburia sp.]